MDIRFLYLLSMNIGVIYPHSSFNCHIFFISVPGTLQSLFNIIIGLSNLSFSLNSKETKACKV